MKSRPIWRPWHTPWIVQQPKEMDDWLGHGGTIVSNRYATSNMAHQGARLSEEKRKEFLDWIDELEYKVHKNSSRRYRYLSSRSMADRHGID